MKLDNGLKGGFGILFCIVLVIIFSLACTGVDLGELDPGTLKIYVEPVQFEDLTSLSLHVSRMEVVITDDPAAKEEILVVSEEPDTVNLVGFSSLTPELFAMYTIYREGYITQIRFIVESADATIGPETYVVDIPSGAQTGEKVIAASETIQIIDGAETSITVRLDPEHSIMQNKGNGYMLKPVVKAEAGITTALPIGEYVPNQITVLFSNTATDAEIEELVRQLGATVVSANPYFPFYLLKLPEGVSVEDAKAVLDSSPITRTSVPNYIMFGSAIPNDPSFNLLWGMNNNGQTGGNVDSDIDATEAWDLTTGSPSIVVAVLDTGVDRSHPDLSQNIWVNQVEASGINNFDDDGNGYVDDIYGWNFLSNNNTSLDDNGHGTHVAGTIGAVGNNGNMVAGVNWTVKIMPLKILDLKGDGTFDAYFNALAYAARNGAHVTNASVGGILNSTQHSDYLSLLSLYDSIGADNMLNVVAAGNAGQNIDKEPCVPKFCYFAPAEFDSTNLITIGASDHKDSIASFSNFGSTSVDMTAPGVNILSTAWGGGTIYYNGTSMAAPHVAGVAALVLSRYPGLIGDPVALRSRIESGVDSVSGHDNIRTGGRLNAYNAVL